MKKSILKRVFFPVLMCLSVVFVLSANIIEVHAAKTEPVEKKDPVDVYIETAEKMSFFSELKFIGNIKPLREIEVFSFIDGIIEKKFRENGSFVKKGEAIAAVKNITPGYSFSNYTVKAPIAGQIIGFEEEEGTMVGKKNAILKIADVSRHRVAIPVLQQNLVHLSGEYKVEIAPIGFTTPINATLLRISPNVDTVLGTSVVEFVFDNTAKVKSSLRLGMVTEVRILYNSVTSIGVSEKCLHENSKGESYILVIDTKGKAEKKYITIGQKSRGKAQIVTGIDDGATVISQSAQRLKGGESVKVDSGKKEKEAGNSKQPAIKSGEITQTRGTTSKAG